MDKSYCGEKQGGMIECYRGREEEEEVKWRGTLDGMKVYTGLLAVIFAFAFILSSKCGLELEMGIRC